jgi:outer membrane protein assembly factor BamB
MPYPLQDDCIAEERDVRNEELLHALSAIYRISDDVLPLEQVQEQAVAHIFERFLASVSQDTAIAEAPALRLVSTPEQPVVKASRAGQQRREMPVKSPWRRFLNLAAAVILLALLVGSMAAVFQLTKRSLPPATGVSHLSGQPPVSPALYVVRNETIYKLSSTKGTLLWKYRMDGPVFGTTTPLVTSSVVYVAHDTYFYALSTKNGSLLWKVHFNNRVSEVPPVIIQSTLYIGLWQDGIYALNRATGAVNWSHAFQGSIINLLAANGAIYGVANNENTSTRTITRFSLDALTGHERWSITETGWNWAIAVPQGTNMEVTISNGIIYATSVACTSSLHASCLYAFSTKTGAQLWHSPALSDFNFYQLTMGTGTIYIAGLLDVYALNATNGNVFWHYAGKRLIDEHLLVTQTTVLTVETDDHGDYLVTLNARTGSLLSRRSLQDHYHLLNNGGRGVVAMDMRELLMNVHVTYVYVYNRDRIEAFDNTTGVLLWQYRFLPSTPANVEGFSLIEVPA